MLASCDVVLGLQEIERDPVDAAIDAAIDAPTNCPSDYGTITGPTKHRFITTAAPFAAHRNDCNDDAPGSTHLAVTATRLEAETLKENLPPTFELYFVGAYQLPVGIAPQEGWVWVSKEFFDNAVWASSEPTDYDGTEDRMEDHAALSTTLLGMVDVPGALTTGAVCECDGKPEMP